MLAARFLTAATLLVLCVAAMFKLPNTWWAAALLAVMLWAAWEWGALAHYGRAARSLFCAAIVVSGVAIYGALNAGGIVSGRVELAVYAVGCAFWALVAPAWLARRWEVRNPLVAAAVGWILLMPAWLAMSRLQLNPAQLLQILGIVWLADTAAYLAGRTWGRHKLAPAISPGKTWEGVAGAVVAVAVYYLLLSNFTSAHAWAAGWGGVMVFACVTATSIVGDLFESWMKRRAGVKDSGTLLPGHGGILDRIDGLTASMPFAALMTRYLG